MRVFVSSVGGIQSVSRDKNEPCDKNESRCVENVKCFGATLCNSPSQTRLRGCRLSASWGTKLNDYLNPSEHHSDMVLRG